MAGYNLKSEEEVKEYLKNLYIEYKFGCYSEKNPEVCHLLGDYEESIKSNYKEAANIYKKNCDERNFGRSCAKYGDYNILGKGCEKNIAEAYKYMTKGCDLNDSRGCCHAGALAVSNEPVEKDRATQVARGMKMLKKACDGDIEKACFYLASFLISGIEGYVEKDFREAYKLSLKCCEMGNPFACGNVSRMHRLGDGVQKNESIANAFKERAETLLEELEKHKRQLKFQAGIDP